MGRKGIKIPNETNLKYAKLCYENKMGKREAARQVGTSHTEICSWVYRYSEQGETGFLDTGNNNVYPDELNDLLFGSDSFIGLSETDTIDV